MLQTSYEMIYCDGYLSKVVAHISTFKGLKNEIVSCIYTNGYMLSGLCSERKRD
jgi:hypothetical protein